MKDITVDDFIRCCLTERVLDKLKNAETRDEYSEIISEFIKKDMATLIDIIL